MGEIMRETGLAKTTIYYHIQDIPLSPGLKKRLARTRRENAKKLVKFSRARKGKCLPGREISMPKAWSPDLIFLVSHLMFDGEIKHYGCIYHNSNQTLIKRVRGLVEKLFGMQPLIRTNYVGVKRACYYHVELASYIGEKAVELKREIVNFPTRERKLFLRAFFDDEGCANFQKNQRRIRGYQKDLRILELVKILLLDFGINSKIDKKYAEIVISRKENLIKFRDEINFSEGIYINPNRKNSIWKKKLEKREILIRMIDSYKAQ